MTNDLFLIIFLVFMIAMTIAPLLLRRLKIPGVIALLLVGMLIGPSGIDLVGKLSE